MAKNVARVWTSEEYVELGWIDDRAAKDVMVPVAVAADVLGYETVTVRAHIRQGKLNEVAILCAGHTVKGISLASVRSALADRASRIKAVKEAVSQIVWHTGGNLIEYADLMDSVGLSSRNPHDRRLIGAALDSLSTDSLSDEGFLISALVVLKATKRPSEGFFKLAREKGLLDGSDEEADWQAQMRLIRRWFDPHAQP
jgi:hypothetical protein